MFLFDPLYFVFLAPGLALSLYATFRTKSTFSKYSQVGSRSGLTGRAGCGSDAKETRC